MTKVYSNTPKDGLRTCVGPEVMKRKVLNCAAVLRPLDVPSTLWKYGRVLSHSAILCITKKEHLLIEYTSTNLVHINLIGGFINKESEIGPYFEYRGFIFHYISPIQQPKKNITVKDLSLKMASYMCIKPYDVFTNNCHQARYLTMKYYGMKSHDPYNIKQNILFQGLVDYFTTYNDIRVKKNLDYDFASESFRSESNPHSSSINDFIKKKDFKNIFRIGSNNKNKKSGKSKSNKTNNKVLSVRCSSTQDISKLGKDADKSNDQLFSHNIHIGNEYFSSTNYLFRERNKFPESSACLIYKNKINSENCKSSQIQRIKVPLRRCKSDTHIPIIRNPYRQHHQQQSNSSYNYSENSPHSGSENSPHSGSENSSSNQKVPHSSKNNNIFSKLKHKDKSDRGQVKKFKFLKAKMSAINHSASENIPQLSNIDTNQSHVIKQKKK